MVLSTLATSGSPRLFSMRRPASMSLLKYPRSHALHGGALAAAARAGITTRVKPSATGARLPAQSDHHRRHASLSASSIFTEHFAIILHPTGARRSGWRRRAGQWPPDRRSAASVDVALYTASRTGEWPRRVITTILIWAFPQIITGIDAGIPLFPRHPVLRRDRSAIASLTMLAVHLAMDCCCDYRLE